MTIAGANEDAGCERGIDELQAERSVMMEISGGQSKRNGSRRCRGRD